MAHVTTTKTNMVIPEVLTTTLEQKMIDLIKLKPLAEVSTELVGQGGDTITVPYYEYIGDAVDLAEGVAGEASGLVANTKQVTVKKIFKAVELTDEAMMSAYANPMVEAERQITIALANKVEKDCFLAMEGVSAGRQVDLSETNTVEISTEGISKAVIEAFGEDYQDVYMFITPKQFHKIRTEQGFVAVNGKVTVSGEVGDVYGVKIVVSNRTTGTKNIMLKQGGLQIAVKRNVQIETDRDVLAKTTVVTADRHCVAWVRDESKVAVATFKETV